MSKCAYCDVETRDDPNTNVHIVFPETPAGTLCIRCQVDTGFGQHTPRANQVFNYCMHRIELRRYGDGRYLHIEYQGPAAIGGISRVTYIRKRSWESGLKLACWAIRRHWKLNAGVPWQAVRGEDERVIGGLICAIQDVQYQATADQRELIHALTACWRAIHEAVQQLDYSVGSEILANVNGFEGSPDVAALLTRLGVAASLPVPGDAPLHRYRISWWVLADEADSDRLSELPFTTWISGSRQLGSQEQFSLCAVVDAPNEEAIYQVIGDVFTDFEPRGCEVQEADWLPGDRFRTNGEPLHTKLS